MGPVFGEHWDKVDKIEKNQLKDHRIGLLALVIGALALVAGVLALVKG